MHALALETSRAYAFFPLPLQLTLVEKDLVTAAHLRLFLCHLYFGAHYCYPPYLPKTDIELNSPPPVSLHFTPVRSLDWSNNSPLRFKDDSKRVLVCNDSLLTLAHYLDCAVMLQQCEAVLLTMAKDCHNREREWLGQQCTLWLVLAERYGLKQWKAACIAAIVAVHDTMAESAQYKTERETWDEALVAELTKAVSTSKQCKRKREESSEEKKSSESEDD